MRAFAFVSLFSAVLAAQPGRPVTDASLRNAAQNGAEWTTYGFTQGETRYSPLRQLTPSNIGRLGLAWSYDLGRGGGNQEATPLFWNGTLFAITNWSVVVAVDARTGQEKWKWDPEVNQDRVRPKICCGVVNRGVALYEGKVIAPVIDGRLVALDAATGKPVWEARVAYPQDNYTITMAPRIAKGKVIIGVSGAEYPVRGFFSAFDARTGALAWRFYTVPGDPSKPFENKAMEEAAKTWSGEFWKLGGGGTVWDGAAYDPDTGLVYVGTGNGGPWPEELRHSRGLANLYLCSILAVKVDTGELAWYFQMVPSDSWDYDSVQQLMLADLTINGRPRKVIMQANKDGFFYVLDRVTGEFISGQPYAKVTWARGLDEKTGRPFINPEAFYGRDLVRITPGPGGAHNWAPMSFNPLTGLVYVPSTQGNNATFAVDYDFEYRPGLTNTGVRRGNNAGGPGGAAAQPAENIPEPPAIGPPLPPEGQRNILLAWDPVAQKERWRAVGGGSIGGGTLSTAGNLVIQVIPDGRLVAYTADQGEKVLDIDTGLKRGMGPPITYELDGKQYVALMGGQGIVIGRNVEPGTPPPPPNADTTFPKLMAFMLDGAPVK